MPAGIWYCTRESVKRGLAEVQTARTDAQIDDAIEAGARNVDKIAEREADGLAPLLATRYFDWPSSTGRPPSWRVRFDGHYLLSSETDATVTVNNGATTIPSGDFFLRPDDGPPYTKLEIDLAGPASLSARDTHQRAIAVRGLWGAGNERIAVGTLASTLGATVNATASLSWTTAAIGIGDVLFIDAEAVVIADRTFVDSGQNLAADLAAEDTATAVSVSDGTGFAVDEVLAVGTERLTVVDIIGNTLSVRRAEDGTQLAAHATGADVYALTGVQLTRAVLGTTIASHNSAAVVYRWRPPGLASLLNRAYALSSLLDERSGYARTISAGGDTAVEISGRSLRRLEDRVREALGPGIRTRGIR